MATTTNFGWETPDDTDLVKDGAAAMRTLGNSIDTSFVDLKGGTTGQILSKASNTDLDYTWISNQVGDITAVTAGTGITGGGTSGDVTVSFDQGNFGGGQSAAGKNVVINGGMDIWQRSTSSSSLGNYFTADRWYQGAWSGTGTWAQESTVVPTSSRYSAKFTASATAQPYFITAIETMNAISLAGKTVTLSAKFAASASTTLDMILQFSTTVDNGVTGSYTQITPTSGGTVTATSTTFVSGSGTFAVPSNAKTLRIILQTSGTIASAAVIYIGQVQLEASATATPFQRAAGNIQGELAACQRYYWRTALPSAEAPIGAGAANATTTCFINVNHPVSMRVAPTAIDYSGIFLSDLVSGFTTFTNFTINQAQTNTSSLYGIGFTGLTQYRGLYLRTTTTAGYLGLSAEL